MSLENVMLTFQDLHRQHNAAIWKLQQNIKEIQEKVASLEIELNSKKESPCYRGTIPTSTKES